MNVILSIALIVAGLAVLTALAAWGPTLPTVKSSAQKRYATTMDTDNNTGTDEALTDPNDFSGDNDFRRMIDSAFDLSARYRGVTTQDILRALEAAVAEGDQR